MVQGNGASVAYHRYYRQHILQWCVCVCQEGEGLTVLALRLTPPHAVQPKARVVL